MYDIDNSCPDLNYLNHINEGTPVAPFTNMV